METEVQAQGPVGHPRPSSQQALLRPNCPQEAGLMGAQYYHCPGPGSLTCRHLSKGGRVPQDKGCAPKCIMHGILTRC